MAKVAGSRSKGSRSSRAVKPVKPKPTGTKDSAPVEFVVCIDAAGNDDLRDWHIYQTLPDTSSRGAFIRVIDDTGKDYLYSSGLFLPLQPSSSLRAALQRKKSSDA